MVIKHLSSGGHGRDASDTAWLPAIPMSERWSICSIASAGRRLNRARCRSMGGSHSKNSLSGHGDVEEF